VIDRAAAETFLRHVNYYRFSGYGLAFESSRHTFIQGVCFDDIRMAYVFDVALRDCVTEALEVIEIDIRSNIALIFGQRYGATGHTIRGNFRTQFCFDDWTVKIHEESARSNELFVEHFRQNYLGFPNLPCWIVTEVMSFGALSKMYYGLLDQCQTPIANRYGMQKGDLASALHHLSYVRNVSANHCRLWDRIWAIEPRLPRGQNWQSPLIPDRRRVFASLLLMYRVLKKCSGQESFAVDWRRRINELMKQTPRVQNALDRMGMPKRWYAHPLWR